MKIQHRFLRGTFSKILGIDVQVDICGGFMVGGHSTAELPLQVGDVPTVWVLVGGSVTSHYRNGGNGHSQFWARSHPCNTVRHLAQAQMVAQKGQAEKKFKNFFNFSSFESKELVMVVPVTAATSVCKENSNNNSTNRCLQAPGAAVLAFLAVPPSF